MLIYIYLLSLFSFQYLADAVSISASYLKVQTPVSMVNVTTVVALKVKSRTQCSLECLSRSCLCFSYDPSLQECGIGNCLSPNSDTSNAQEFFVSCNSNEGFRLFTSGSVTACVWVSNTKADYATARNDCIARSAQLYTVKTIDKLNILRDNFPPGYWVGLNDIAVEDTFRWEDDNTICDLSCRTLIFRSGEPSNYNGNENCAFYNNNGLNDISCSDNSIFYICEKNFV